MPWAKPVLIENAVSRAFLSSLVDQEQGKRARIRDYVEAAVTGLPSRQSRFWMSEYDFLAKMLTANQLKDYAPYFVHITRVMPKKLLFFRRIVVEKYIRTLMPNETEFFARQRRKFVRGSVLFYPADILFVVTDRFNALVVRSLDQSGKANRKRVIMSVRALQRMSDTEICTLFVKEHDYHIELEFLEVQCRYFAVQVSEIYQISSRELSQFWSG